jgi:hypothetical protein
MAKTTTETDTNTAGKPPPQPDGAGDAVDLADNGESAIPSAEPGNIIDLASFADDDEDPVRSNIKRVRCSLCRPDNFTRFRTWPDQDWWRTFHFLIREQGGQGSLHFLVHKPLLDLDELEGRTKRKRLIPYITYHDALGFWPLGVDDSNAYVASGLWICQQAIKEWACAVSKGRQDGEYLYKAPNPHKAYRDPQWPEDLTLNGMLNLAFPRDRQILSPDHPELVKLREED